MSLVPAVKEPRGGFIFSNTPDLAVESFLHTETISCSSQALTRVQTTVEENFSDLKLNEKTLMGQFDLSYKVKTKNICL